MACFKARYYPTLVRKNKRESTKTTVGSSRFEAPCFIVYCYCVFIVIDFIYSITCFGYVSRSSVDFV